MKKVLLGIAALLGIAVLAVAALASTKPATFRVERKQVIAAPPDVVFANLEDFHRWTAWSPWEKLDPQLSRTYSGQAKGTGAVYDWQGNNQVGRGRMTIVDSHAPERVAIRLEFFEPFAADNRTLFTLTPAGNGTEVSWDMSGENTFMGKVMSVFADMDSMVGGDFERGLANLKQVSEAAATASAH